MTPLRSSTADIFSVLAPAGAPAVRIVVWGSVIVSSGFSSFIFLCCPLRPFVAPFGLPLTFLSSSLGRVWTFLAFFPPPPCLPPWLRFPVTFLVFPRTEREVGAPRREASGLSSSSESSSKSSSCSLSSASLREELEALGGLDDVSTAEEGSSSLSEDVAGEEAEALWPCSVAEGEGEFR